QVYLAPAAGGPARKVTSLTCNLAHPQWSPDGKQLALLFIENAPRASGPVAPGTPEVGVIEEKIYEQRLTLVDPDSGRARQLTTGDLYVHEYDWSPDGRNFAAVVSHGEGDNNWYIAELYRIPAESGDPKSILKPGMQIAEPRWSPDGNTIAFIGG